MDTQVEVVMVVLVLQAADQITNVIPCCSHTHELCIKREEAWITQEVFYSEDRKRMTVICFLEPICWSELSTFPPSLYSLAPEKNAHFSLRK